MEVFTLQEKTFLSMFFKNKRSVKLRFDLISNQVRIMKLSIISCSNLFSSLLIVHSSFHPLYASFHICYMKIPPKYVENAKPCIFLNSSFKCSKIVTFGRRGQSFYWELYCVKSRQHKTYRMLQVTETKLEKELQNSIKIKLKGREKKNVKSKTNMKRDTFRAVLFYAIYCRFRTLL